MAAKKPVKNLTGSAISYRGKTYPIGAEIPGDLAAEMGLESLPAQIAGQQSQQQQLPITINERDPFAIAAAQFIVPPPAPASREIPATLQNEALTPSSNVIDLEDQELPENLEGLEEQPPQEGKQAIDEQGEQPPPPETEVKKSRRSTNS
jgi:hypothetical protein